MSDGFTISRTAAAVLLAILAVLVVIAVAAARKHMASMKKHCEPPLGNLKA